MSRRRRVLSNPPLGLPPDIPFTYKGSQIQGFRFGGSPGDDWQVPSAAELIAANCRHARIFAYDYGNTKTYINSLVGNSTPIYVIACGGVGHGNEPTRNPDTQAGVEANVIELVSQIDVGAHGAYEIGNERQDIYKGGTSWSEWFKRIEWASPIVRANAGRPTAGRMVMGAAERLDTGAYLTAARNHFGTTAAEWRLTVDAVAVHPYGAGANYNAKIQKTKDVLNTARGLVPQEIPLWVTEMGWGVADTSGSPFTDLVAKEGLGSVHERNWTQSALLNEIYDWLYAHAAKNDLNLQFAGWFINGDYYADSNNGSMYEFMGLRRGRVESVDEASSGGTAYVNHPIGSNRPAWGTWASKAAFQALT